MWYQSTAPVPPVTSPWLLALNPRVAKCCTNSLHHHHYYYINRETIPYSQSWTHLLQGFEPEGIQVEGGWQDEEDGDPTARHNQWHEESKLIDSWDLKMTQSHDQTNLTDMLNLSVTHSGQSHIWLSAKRCAWKEDTVGQKKSMK